MNKLTTEQIKEKIWEMAIKAIEAIKADFEEGSELSPEVFFVMYFPEYDTVEFEPIPRAHKFFQNEESKSDLEMYVKVAAMALDVSAVDPDKGKPEFFIQAVVTIADSYVSSRSTKSLQEKGYIKPSEDPDRTEAIIFVACLESESYTISFPYSWVGGKIIFHDHQIIENERNGVKNITGRFTRLFPTGIHT